MSFIRKIKKDGKTYLAEVESKRVNGKVVQKFIRYVGKEVDNKTILSGSISNIQVDSVKLYGPLIVLDALAKSINLHEHLGEYSNEILSLVYAHCVEPRSINKMNNWFKKTDLNYILNLDNLTEARLLEALDDIENNDMEQIQMDIFKDVKKSYKLNPSGIIYDVTNTYFYGKKCILGKVGHSKQNQNDKPLVQIGLGVTREDGIPVFHKTYDGNIHDARTMQDAVSIFNRFGIEDVIVVYDRGIGSKNNVVSLKKEHLGSICGLPIRQNLKKIVKAIKTKKDLVNINKRVKLSKSVFYVTGRNYKLDNVTGKLLICYNSKIAHDVRESRYDEIMNAEDLLKEGKRIKTGLYKYFDSSGKIKETVIKTAEEFDGYSCLFSTEKLDNKKIIEIYFEKDLIEKAFRSLHGIIKLRPIRHWLYNRVVAHIFICYLAYLLLSLLKYKLKKAKIKESPVDALKELETLYKVYMKEKEKGFRLTRIVQLSKKQEKIMKSVDKKICSV